MQGRLNRMCFRNEFEICKENFFSIDDIPRDKEISLRLAVAGASVTGRSQGVFRFGCKLGCSTTNRCKCKAANQLCNNRCHDSSSCCNKELKMHGMRILVFEIFLSSDEIHFNDKRF